MITAISVDVYTTKLQELAGNNKIMNTEDAETLAGLRDFLGLEMEQVAEERVIIE